MSEVQLKYLSPQHLGMIDFIIENMHERGWREKVCAQYRITRSWLSIIWKSDAFREGFNARLAEVRGETTRELQSMQIKLAQKAYEKLMQALDDDAIEAEFVLDVANSTMKNLGFGPQPGAAPRILREQEVSRSVTREVAPGVLETARETYRKLTCGDEQLPALSER